MNDPWPFALKEAISSRTVASCKVALHILQFAGRIRSPSTLLACDLVVGASGSASFNSSYQMTRYDREPKPFESVQNLLKEFLGMASAL